MGTFIQLVTLTFGLVVISRTCATNEDPVRDEMSMENLIRSVLTKLCPGANVCLDNQTTPVVPSESLCCTDCSCAEECEDVGNCCFKRNNSGKDRWAFESECVFPTAPQPVGKNRIHYQSYRMVTDVPRYNERGKKIVEKCGDEKVTAWGSMHPVFSPSAKKIYKNIACANAANVTDGEHWAAFLVCDRSNDASSLIYELNLDTIPDHCEIQFKYLQDKFDLTSLTCFENLIDSCGEDNFEIPNILPLSKEDISNACSSGFISPYRQYDMYANIFCHICNDKVLVNIQSCVNVYNIRGPSGKGFFSLLDSHLMRDVYKSVKQLKLNAPLACSSAIDDEGIANCRPVHCPLGQIRDEHGKCVFMMKKLYMRKCSIVLKLTANVSFSVNDTFNRSVWIADTDISHLSHNWPNNWLISKVFYDKENETNSDMAHSLTVEMLNESPINDLKALLKNINHYLQKQWTLELVNETLITMSAYISDETIPFYHNSIEFIRNSAVLGNFTYPTHEALYLMSLIERGDAFPITRLYYCEQVQLSTHEFEWFGGIIFNKITNKPHFPGEYTTSTYVNDNARYSARICIQNSGFTKSDGANIVNGSGIVPTRTLQKNCICLFIAVFQLSLSFFS